MHSFDLHFHSNHSDGKSSVQELAAIIKAKKLRYCALVDHDTVAGIRELQHELRDTEITIIPGVELTAQYGENDIHVLAYDFDVDAVGAVMEKRNKLVTAQKIEEMEKSKELFKQQGIIITDGLEPVEKKPVGYTLAVDICKNPVNQALFLSRHGRELVRDDIFFEYSAPGKSCAVKRSGVTIEWLLTELKGLVKDFIIAHPFLSVSLVIKPLDEEKIFDLLRMGITGVEVYHDKTSEEHCALLKKIVAEKDLRFSGGSDFHGKEKDIAIGYYEQNKPVPGFKLARYKSIQ